ncbi:GNAT family N-acetyltransferase [Tropicimonas sp. TH_r6]|uniref:GNAT family N-acetyltransferase n=1 Tax=Tropicimonas sp. TH_r6 TaxID=3082085 RepID=UPI002952B644|nr:GNAT family N-acetyltransferase [Tropicimonas sp. TH_r6]MDV7145690.1 GNAT family N-acetyltransferase [Tropicimonas sp. TH_r6]
MQLEDGFHDVPAGKLATVVTWLEMRAVPAPRPAPDRDDLSLRRVETPGIEWYRTVFRRVGAEDWLWFSRLVMPEAALAVILHDPGVEVYALRHGGEDTGLLELDFREDGACELTFFGISSELIGAGAGRWLMNRALEIAWSRPITRFHLHTCTLDHPAALDFYRRSGFTAIRRQVEIADDPRLTGHLDARSAQQIPIIR